MGATRGATDAFSGVSRHVTDSVSQISLLPFQSCEYPGFSWKKRENDFTRLSIPQSLILLSHCPVEEGGSKEHWSRHWMWCWFWPWFWSRYVIWFASRRISNIFCVSYIYMILSKKFTIKQTYVCKFKVELIWAIWFINCIMTANLNLFWCALVFFFFMKKMFDIHNVTYNQNM